jgi:hypothetical protein
MAGRATLADRASPLSERPSGLPFIDAYQVDVNAEPERVWEATARLLPGIGGRFGPAFARLLGCSEVERPALASHELPDAIVGFRVERAERPSLIELRGEHRFARYALTFRIEPGTSRGSVLIAETDADFRGPAGCLYRAAVIGTSAHVVLVRKLLRTVKRGAERVSYPAGQPAGSSRPRSSYTDTG